MNKTHWISVIVDFTEEEKLKMLVDMSFELTDAKKSPVAKRRKTTNTDNK